MQSFHENIDVTPKKTVPIQKNHKKCLDSFENVKRKVYAAVLLPIDIPLPLFAHVRVSFYFWYRNPRPRVQRIDKGEREEGYLCLSEQTTKASFIQTKRKAQGKNEQRRLSGDTQPQKRFRRKANRISQTTVVRPSR